MQAKLPLGMSIKKRLTNVVEKKVQVFGLLILGIVLGAIISFILPKKYRSISNVYLKYNSVNSSFISNNGSLENEISYLKSADLLQIVSDRLAPMGYALGINEISDSEEILEDKSATMLELNVVADQAQKSTDIANTIVESFSQKSILNSRAAFINFMRVITERDEILQGEIRRELANQQRSQSLSLNKDNDLLVGQIAEFESELESIELDNHFYNHQNNSFQTLLDEEFPIISGDILFLNNTQLLALKNKLERIETQNILSSVVSKLNNFPIQYNWEEYNISELNEVRRSFNDGLNDYVNNISKTKKIDNIDFLKNLTNKYFDNQIKLKSVDLTKSIIFNTLTNLESKFNLIPFSIIDVARQLRMQKFNNKLSLKIKTKLQNLKDREKDFFAEVESIKTAEVPKTYFSPNIILNSFLGGIVGLLIGFFSVFNSYKKKIDFVADAKDLEEAGFKIISQIPAFPSGSPVLLDSLNQADQKKLDPKILNSLLNIETFLKYGSLDKTLHTIMFTSGQDGEGKSVIASNTAITLANSGNKVLLIDADLKNPQLNNYFKIKSTPSLAHYLFRKKELNEIIRGTHNKNLDIITCIEFPQNPSVIITSERMKNFMDEVKGTYDYVIYDTCSLCSLKETAAIAKDIDEVILIARANKTKLTEMSSTVDILRENGVTHFNVVLNDVL